MGFPPFFPFGDGLLSLLRRSLGIKTKCFTGVFCQLGCRQFTGRDLFQCEGLQKCRESDIDSVFTQSDGQSQLGLPHRDLPGFHQFIDVVGSLQDIDGKRTNLCTLAVIEKQQTQKGIKVGAILQQYFTEQTDLISGLTGRQSLKESRVRFGNTCRQCHSEFLVQLQFPQLRVKTRFQFLVENLSRKETGRSDKVDAVGFSQQVTFTNPLNRFGQSVIETLANRKAVVTGLSIRLDGTHDF